MIRFTSLFLFNFYSYECFLRNLSKLNQNLRFVKFRKDMSEFATTIAGTLAAINSTSSTIILIPLINEYTDYIQHIIGNLNHRIPY